MSSPPLFVTRPALPPLADFTAVLEDIWESRVLTNGGPYHKQLEADLAVYLGVPHVSLVNNGTVALQLALLALNIHDGEVVTTPYSFAATSHAIAIAGARPVFADIGPSHFNLDPALAEAAITPQTRAIMPVHCYGRPCDVEAFEAISARYGIPVIYDAAHAFGVTHGNGSLLNHGRLAVLSFHATKVFNTFEGGAIISQTIEDKARIDLLRNFGIASEDEIPEIGINGKMSEINAALGVLQLRRVDADIAARGAIDRAYRDHLQGVAGILVPDLPEGRANYGYFPILIGRTVFGRSRDELYNDLKQAGVLARKYFYPLLSNLAVYRALESAAAANLPQGNAAAQSVLCLPIYPGLDQADVARVCQLIRG
ncbi:MAG: DegT/DnrJ/EryC1/StrS family aminotransferase [Novosphingobium sp.]